MILEDYDENKEAIINPSDLNEKVVGFPKTVVTCFA
ncbi:phosphorylase, partial [Streptococcus suis]